MEWIQINGSGKNALDFHITFMLGRLTERDPTAVFHIISKDTGFDPLVSYLKSQKLLCKRSDDLSLITSLIWDEKLSLEDTCNIIIQKLILNDKSRPGSETTLKNYIKAHLGLKEALPIIDEVYQKLFDTKKIKLNSTKKIEYNF